MSYRKLQERLWTCATSFIIVLLPFNVFEKGVSQRKLQKRRRSFSFPYFKTTLSAILLTTSHCTSLCDYCVPLFRCKPQKPIDLKKRVSRMTTTLFRCNSLRILLLSYINDLIFNSLPTIIAKLETSTEAAVGSISIESLRRS